MRIHIIGTINGQANEGMRNVATHLHDEFKKSHEVYPSQLKEILSIIIQSIHCDVTFVFARANKLIYWLCRLVEKLCPNVWMVLVQKPDKEFQSLNKKRALACNWLYISDNDVEDIVCKAGFGKYCFQVGIDIDKFKPVSHFKVMELRAKYGVSCDKPLIVHVGHCSSGRGLNDFLDINSSTAERLIVASGMFEDEATVKKLEANHIHLLKGYIENIEEIYQMADMYLFPTRSTNYVISVPLSVMEALACGTPVIAYDSFNGLKNLNCTKGSITYIANSEEIENKIGEVKLMKSTRSLLKNPFMWNEVANKVLTIVEHSKR